MDTFFNFYLVIKSTVLFISGDSPHIVTWCRTYNDTYRALKTSIPIPFDPSESFHRYKIKIVAEKEEAVDVSLYIRKKLSEK